MIVSLIKPFLLAYPFSDPTVPTTYAATLGVVLVMKCTVPVGALRERYSVGWYKGHSEISPNPSSDEFQHISVDVDYALVFSEVKASDVSGAYFCIVNATREDDATGGDEVITRQGATIALEVVGKVFCVCESAEPRAIHSRGDLKPLFVVKAHH